MRIEQNKIHTSLSHDHEFAADAYDLYSPVFIVFGYHSFDVNVNIFHVKKCLLFKILVLFSLVLNYCLMEHNTKSKHFVIYL